MTAKPRHPMTAIKAAITRFDNAAQNYAFKGAAHPDDRDAIAQRYADARVALERLIEHHLQNPGPPQP